MERLAKREPATRATGQGSGGPGRFGGHVGLPVCVYDRGGCVTGGETGRMELEEGLSEAGREEEENNNNACVDERGEGRLAILCSVHLSCDFSSDLVSTRQCFSSGLCVASHCVHGFT